jgi:hypothetical protein
MSPSSDRGGYNTMIVDVYWRKTPPDLRPAVEIAERFHPSAGSAIDGADREQVRQQLRSGLTPGPGLRCDGR